MEKELVSEKLHEQFGDKELDQSILTLAGEKLNT